MGLHEEALRLKEIDRRLKQAMTLYPLEILLHAPEDEGRTEDATEHRKRKAREEEGRVFLTQELPQAAVLLLSLSCLLALSFYYNRILKEYFIKYLSIDTFFSLEHPAGILGDAVTLMLKFIMPVGSVAVAAAVFGTMMQTGFHISSIPLRFNISRIIPSWENFRRRTIFSNTQLINTSKIFIKFAAIFLLVFLFLRYFFPHLSMLPRGSLVEAYREIGWLIYKLFAAIAAVFLLLAIPDWFLQRMEFERSLKMTRQEVKQEFKELEGDPYVRARIRERSRELAQRDMLKNAETADVVVTNPTHYACAIQYEMLTMDAPKLVAKGQDHLAQRIREIAEEHSIPIVENKPLARSLYTNVVVDTFIPMEYYGAVAEILAALDKYRGESVN